MEEAFRCRRPSLGIPNQSYIWGRSIKNLPKKWVHWTHQFLLARGWGERVREVLEMFQQKWSPRPSYEFRWSRDSNISKSGSDAYCTACALGIEISKSWVEDTTPGTEFRKITRMVGRVLSPRNRSHRQALERCCGDSDEQIPQTDGISVPIGRSRSLSK